MSVPRAPRSSRRVVAALGVAVLAATTFASVAGASTDPVRDVLGTLHYAVTKPVCSQPSDLTAMRCFAYKRVDVRKGTKGAYAYRTAASRGPVGGYTPGALAHAYGYSPKTKRSGLTVGIVLWHDAPRVLHDLNRFDAHYGLKKETSRSFRKVNQRGKASPLPRPDRGAAGEMALDTQAVRAVCNTCRILLVEANGPYDTDLAKAVNTAVRLGADVVSNSYGTPERRLSSAVTHAYRHPGVVMTASTGDAGWFGWDYANGYGDRGDGRASFPGTSPYVVSVGGTTLRLTSHNNRSSETVWNGDGPHDSVGRARRVSMGASGGGCSKYFAAQPFQAHYPGYAAAGCKGKRLAADMSLVADPETGFDVYDSYGSGGWVTLGGTSLSAPVAAGMYALAGGARGAAYPASAVYGNGKVHTTRRYDVRAGGNGFCGTDSPAACAKAVYKVRRSTHNPNRLGLGLVDCTFSRSGSESVPRARRSECNAVTGYDGASGVGAPDRTSLFSRTDPYLSISAPSKPKRHKSLKLTAHVREPLANTRATIYKWTWDHHSSRVTHSRTLHHTFKKAGRHRVSLKVIDSRYQISYYAKVLTIRR